MFIAPQFQASPTDYIIETSAEAISFDLSNNVHCAANSLYAGDSGLDVSWYRVDGGRWESVNPTFANFTSKNNGLYMCQAQNYFGTISSRPVHVELYGKFVQSPHAQHMLSDLRDFCF